MADNTTNFTLKLKTEGLENAQKGTKQIRDNLEGAQAAAQGIGTPGSASSRRFASSAGARPTGAAGVSAGVEGGDVEIYNRARGAAGAAGGTARDFADQARGLGGLVRIYATLAANVFALGAAFSALSRAMDTTNMVKGLDQLGAASGTALGGLSKRLFLATEGAVSLREAMEATVKASSAGLNTNQILQLGDVAKKASQALGLNMTDALSRLSRGISKLEPELLDELGIFVKIDDATSKYALSVGKSTSALTDFERRQAFANAVLEQGTKKFGEINIDSNPYNKLAASFQNLVQSGLELINKVFGPIAKIFADNSALLAAAIGLIGVKILKMAIPALGEWQQQLVKSADLARKKATEINTAFGEAWVDRWENRLKIPELREGVNAATKELKKLGQPTGMGDTIESGYKSVLKGEQLTKTQLAATTLAINSKKAELQSLSGVQTAQSAKQSANLQKEILQLEAIIALDKERLALATAQTKIDTAAEATPGFFSGEAQRNRLSKGASTTAIALGELAALPAQTMEKGFIDSLKNMKANLDKQGVGFIKTWVTMAVGALAAGTVAIQAFIASIMFWVAAVALVGAAIYGALKYFSATKKESELTSEAMGRLEESTKSAALTLEKLSMAPDPLQSLSVESIQARANALKELGDSGALAVKRALDEISKMNAGDKFLNWVSKLWGGDVQTKLSEGLADSLRNAFKLAEDTELTAEAKKSIESIIGTSIQSADLDKTIKKLAASGDDAKLKQVVKIIEDMGNAAAVSAAKGTELKESIKRVSTGIQEFNKSLIPTDNLSKIAQDSTVAAQKLGEALKDPVQALTAMRDVSGSIDLLSIFPADVAKNLMSYNGELTGIAQRVAQAKVQTQQYDKEVEKLNKEIQRLQTTGSAGINTQALVDQYKRQVQAIEDQKIELKAGIDADTTKIKTVFDQAVRASLIQSAELMAARLAAEMNKARTAVTGAMAGLLGDTLGGVKLRADLEKQSIAASMEVTKQSFTLANKMEELKIEMERKRLQDQKLFLETKKTQFGEESLTREEKNSLEQMKTRLPELDRMDTALKGRGMGESSVQLAKSGASQDVVALQQRFEQFRVSLAGAAAQIQAIDLKTFYEEQRKIFEQSQKDLQVRIDTANTEKERIGLISSIYGIENQIATNAKIQAENKAQQLADEKARNVLVQSTDEKASLYLRALSDATKSGKSLTKEQETQLEYFRLAVVESGKEVDRFDEALAARKAIKKVNDEILRISSEAAAEQKRLEYDKQLKESAQELKQIQLSTTKQQFDSLVSRGLLDEEYAAQRTAEFALEAQQIQFNKQLSDAAAQKRLDDLQAEAQFRKVIAAGGNEIDALIEWAAQTDKNNTLYQNRLNIINASNVLTQQGIELEKGKALEVAKTNKLLEDQKERAEAITALGDSLAAVFGKAGEGLSGLLGALNNIVTSQETYNSKLEEQYNIMDSSRKIMDDPSKSEKEKIDATNAYNKAQKETGKLSTKNAKDELSNSAKLAGAAKSLFKEKTFAYKAFAAIEKAIHIAKIAMMIKEMLFDKKSVGETIVNSATKSAAKGTEAGVDGVAAVVKAMAAFPPPWNYVAAAAVAATVASLLSSIGQSGPDAPAGGSTAPDRQEVQGTGMEWRDGKKVETGRGVFGDPEAKSDSIRKSIERIKETSVEGITYASRTVKLLESIDRSIGGAAQELYGVQGLRAGTAFGTQEGTSSSGIQGLFGSKRSTEIIDAGIKFAGTFLDVMMGRAGSIMQYETTRTTKKSSGFLGIGGSTKTWESTLEKDLGQVNQTAAREVSKIFTNAGDLMIELGGQLGQTQEQVLSSLSRVDLTGRFASLRGLKGEELQKELSAVISSILDDAATVAFKSLERFRKFGEGMAETVIRVLDSNQKISDSFVAMGGKTLDAVVQEAFGNQQVTERIVTSVTLPFDQIEMATEMGFNRIASVARGSWLGITSVVIEEITRPISEAELKEKSLEISEGLAELAGGLDKFLEKQKFFVDNFLTEAERLDPIRRGLTDQLNALGLGFVDTRDEFKQVVLALSQNVTTEGGRELYNAVLDLAPAFNQVYQEVEDVKEALSTLELRSRLLDQEVTILGLLGREQEALTIKRQRELDELRKYPGLQGELMAANQEYIYALEDEKALKDKLIKQRDKEKQALETTIKNLSTAIDTLNKYRANLLTGSMTILSPEQQYQQNKSRFEELSLKLRTGTTEERIAAASELQASADKFLDSSRAMFASGSNYATDFNSVLSVLDESTELLSTQKTDAEKSLDELMRATSFLDTIDDNTKTTNELLDDYLLAQERTREEDRQRQELRDQWEESLLASMTAAPEITLDVLPIVTGLVEVRNALLAQSTASAGQATASMAVTHADLQGILGELELLRRAVVDRTVDINSFSPTIDTGVMTCFPRGTKIMLADGTQINIEDVVMSDILMGADGVPVKIKTIDRPKLGPKRKLLSFLEDPSMRWSDEHLFWAKKEGKQWWWVNNHDNWLKEVHAGEIVGLKDNYSHIKYDTSNVQFAHLNGFLSRTVIDVTHDSDGAETQLYLPVTETGVPILVCGYVVTGGANEFKYDYTKFDWNQNRKAVLALTK